MAFMLRYSADRLSAAGAAGTVPMSWHLDLSSLKLGLSMLQIVQLSRNLLDYSGKLTSLIGGNARRLGVLPRGLRATSLPTVHSAARFVRHRRILAGLAGGPAMSAAGGVHGICIHFGLLAV